MAAPESTSAPVRRGTGRSRARRLAGFATGALIFAFLLWGLARGWGQVADYEWQLEPLLLTAAVFVVFIAFLVSGLGFIVVVGFLGIPHTVSRLELLSAWARSLLGRYVPGTVVMLASRVVLAREVGVPAKVTLAASVYEQVLLLTTAALASLAFVIVYGSTDVPWWLPAAAAVAGLALISPRVFRPLSTWALRKAGREPLAQFLSGPQLLALLLLYAIANLLMGIGVWLLVRSATVVGMGDPAYVALAFLFSFTLGMLAWIVPSGLGVRDAAFALALGRDLTTGVAIALAAGVRIALTVIELGFVATVVTFPRLRTRWRKRHGAIS